MKGSCYECGKLVDLEVVPGWEENPHHNIEGYVAKSHYILNTGMECDGSGMMPNRLVSEPGDWDGYDDDCDFDEFENGSMPYDGERLPNFNDGKLNLRRLRRERQQIERELNA